jgi:hypothetical protein
MKIEVVSEITGAKVKLSRLAGMDWYFRKKMSVWRATTIEHIKRQASGPLIGTRTGHLKRNIGAKLVNDEGKPGMVIGTGEQIGKQPVIYASIQEEGGVIKAKSGKALTIPFPGVTGRIRNYPDGFFIKSKLGNTIFVHKVGEKIVPLFSLRKQVTIPARHWLSIPINQRIPLLNEVFQAQEFADDMMNAGADTGGSYD